MRRLWQVRPDHVIQTMDGEVAAVSREAMRDAMLDMESMLARAGGVATIVVGRAPTGIDGESVTTGAIFEWKNRVDGKVQPEEHGEVLPEQRNVARPEPEPGAVYEVENFPPSDEEVDAAIEATVGDLAAIEDEEEDLSSIPAEHR